MKFEIAVAKPIIPILGFFILASIYFSPLYSGKVLVQSDNIQLRGVNKEITDYREKGDPVYWNSREFSGVPVLGSSELNPIGYVSRALLSNGIIPKPIMMLFLMFLGMFVLLRALKVSLWVSAIGAMAYAFSSFNIISIEVGHDNKVMAMAFMAPVLASVILAYRGELLKGGVLTIISSGFQLYYGHIQITYYLLLMVIGYLVLVIIDTVKNKNYLQFAKASGVLLLATLIGFGCNFTKLYATIEYSGYSNRGGTELKQNLGDQASSSGLDKDYALNWSNGKMETFTLIFPLFYGGASSEPLADDSNTTKVLRRQGVPAQNITQFTRSVPLYWGNQPFTGGPIYFGAIMVFFFVLSFFVLDGAFRWWALTFTVLSLLLAMGKNLEWFTDIFFYNFPLYNKFRSVTMILSMAQLMVPLLGAMALDKVLNSDELKESAFKNAIKVAGGIVILGLFLLIFKNSFFSFQGLNDSAYNLPDWLLSAIQQDRKHLFNWSIFRSIIFIGLMVVGIWAITKKITKSTYVLLALGLLVLIDHWGIDKRYLGEDGYASKRRISEQQFQPSAADNQILKDESYFRVMNLAAQSPFSDGLTSYYHYNILGYNAIKMQRYQELIERYIQEMDQQVLNMLNTKYIINKTQAGPRAQLNNQACGNAWLVKSLTVAKTADEEIEKLGDIETNKEAVIREEFLGNSDELTFTGKGQISLTSYHPEELKYSFSSSDNQMAVFSEIYYEPGWNAYIDGEMVEYARVDYVLRALEIPAGDHEIVFKYEPVSLMVGNKVILFSTFWLIAGLGFLGYSTFQKKGTEND